MEIRGSNPLGGTTHPVVATDPGMPLLPSRPMEIMGVDIRTIITDNVARRCDGCRRVIDGTPWRVNLLDIVAAEAPVSWAERPLINPGPNQTRIEGEGDDPVAVLKSFSGDPDGLEVLAIILDLLSTGYAHVDAGTPDEMYIFPYFAGKPLNTRAIPMASDTPPPVRAATTSPALRESAGSSLTVMPSRAKSASPLKQCMTARTRPPPASRRTASVSSVASRV